MLISWVFAMQIYTNFNRGKSVIVEKDTKIEMFSLQYDMVAFLKIVRSYCLKEKCWNKIISVPLGRFISPWG